MGLQYIVKLKKKKTKILFKSELFKRKMCIGIERKNITSRRWHYG